MQLVDAVLKGDIEAVKKCLSAPGVDVNPNGRYFRIPLDALVNDSDCTADEKTKVEIPKLLMDAGAKTDRVLRWTACPAALIKLVLSATPPPDVNEKSANGTTPLHDHATQGNAEQCQLLVDAKANVNAQDDSGYTPLIMASFRDAERCQRLLIDAKADVNKANKYGYTPLINAVEYGILKAIPILLAAGADVTIKTEKGETAMTISPHATMIRACIECKELLGKLLNVEVVSTMSVVCV